MNDLRVPMGEVARVVTADGGRAAYKECQDCGESKPVPDFRRIGKRVSSYCKGCFQKRVARGRSNGEEPEPGPATSLSTTIEALAVLMRYAGIDRLTIDVRAKRVSMVRRETRKLEMSE